MVKLLNIVFFFGLYVVSSFISRNTKWRYNKIFIYNSNVSFYLSLTAAIYLENLKLINPRKYNILLLLLAIVYFHNLPAMLSHFGTVSI